MITSKKIIDGKKLAEIHAKVLCGTITKLLVKPKVVSIIVGDDIPSILYTKIKEKKAKEVGVDFEPKFFPRDVSFEQIVKEIKELNQNQNVYGVMVQLPVPQECLGTHSEKELLQNIDPQKDVDGLTENSPFLPAVVRAVLAILEDVNIKVVGKKVVVIGASDLVGKPVADELKKRSADILICDINTVNLSEQTKKAEIIVSATGVPHLITSEMISEGVTIIDVGSGKVGNKVVGDVDFDSVIIKASKITPVPGGVGPMTVISLLENVAKAVEN